MNRTGYGLIRDFLLGVIGALFGGAIFHSFGYVGVTGFNLWNILVALFGAVVVLVAYHTVTGQLVARTSQWR